MRHDSLCVYLARLFESKYSQPASELLHLLLQPLCVCGGGETRVYVRVCVYECVYVFTRTILYVCERESMCHSFTTATTQVVAVHAQTRTHACKHTHTHTHKVAAVVND